MRACRVVPSVAGCLSALGASPGTAQAPCTPPAEAQYPCYDLTVHVEPEARRLTGSGTVLIPASDRDRDTLRFALSKSFARPVLEFLEPEELRGALTFRDAWQNDLVAAWDIPLRVALKAGRGAVVRFRYEGGERPGDMLSVSPQGAYASGASAVWYPEILLPARGNPPVTGRLRLSAPAGYTIVGPGGEDRPAGDSLRNARTFLLREPGAFTFGVGRFAYVRRDGPVPVELYLSTPRSGMRARAAEIERILGLYGEWFGPYPGRRWLMVEAPGPRAAAGGSGGVILMGSRLLDEWNTLFFAHEIAHAYFGGDFLGSEGLSNYATLQVVEALHGAAAAERLRRTGAPGYNEHQSGLGYLRISAAGLDVPLVARPEKPPAYQVAYGKGMLVFDMLARTVGREPFHRFLRAYLPRQRRDSFRAFTWADFFRELGDHTGSPVDWFYAQWLERIGAPEWRLAWVTDGGVVRAAIEQPPPYYRAAVPLVAYANSGATSRRTVSVDGPRTAFVWPLGFRPESLAVDPHFETLHWTPAYRALASAVVPYTRSVLGAPAPRADSALRAALRVLPQPDTIGVEFAVRFALGRLLLRRGDPNGARQEFEAALAVPVRRTEDVATLLLRLADAADSAGLADVRRRALLGAIAADVLGGRKSPIALRAERLLRPPE